MAEPKQKYDVVIIGGGPAGLSAGIYTARARLSTLLIEKGGIGGQIINSEMVENYPGFSESVSGIDLTQAMHKQADKFGVVTVYEEVTGIKVTGKQKTVGENSPTVFYSVFSAFLTDQSNGPVFLKRGAIISRSLDHIRVNSLRKIFA